MTWLEMEQTIADQQRELEQLRAAIVTTRRDAVEETLRAVLGCEDPEHSHEVARCRGCGTPRCHAHLYHVNLQDLCAECAAGARKAIADGDLEVRHAV